jgi:uncharacterized membrane protein
MITTASALMNRPDQGVARRSERSETGVNVGDAERWASALGGAALALYGLKRGTLGGLVLALGGGSLVYRGLSGQCSLYSAFGINTAGAPKAPATSVRAGRGVKVEKSITVNRSPTDLFRFWRKLENLPLFMTHLQSVTTSPGNRSHWVARAPLGVRMEWDAEIINEKENEVIAWRSLEGSEVDNAGSVHFTPAPGGHGTAVRVILKYDPPGGGVAAAIARLLGDDPGAQIEEELRRFKQLMEVGEVPRANGKSRPRAQRAKS